MEGGVVQFPYRIRMLPTAQKHRTRPTKSKETEKTNMQENVCHWFSYRFCFSIHYIQGQQNQKKEKRQTCKKTFVIGFHTDFALVYIIAIAASIMLYKFEKSFTQYNTGTRQSKLVYRVQFSINQIEILCSIGHVCWLINIKCILLHSLIVQDSYPTSIVAIVKLYM